MLQVKDRLHGFVVKEVRPLPELKAVMIRMEYEKNGAKLLWLDRADENKTFAITFKTLPRDDTGVFHILEHSVLCGSRKYPVREPFVELLKSSLQTFLNAMTFPDKTMYPLSSRNDRDFLNLMDVYLDAVLHPLSIEDPHAFRQEGWHFELDELEGEPRFNGVVYNEMKGAYASADSVRETEMDRLLFPNTCYGYDSGGDPAHITDLTYENYLESHHRYYHPSNSYIVLDGSIDLHPVLEKLDRFLRDFDALDMDTEIPMQMPVAPEERVCEYEIGPDEAPENKVLLSGGYVFGTYADLEKSLAYSVLASVLCGSNEAPLKKALLEENLAENISFQSMDSMLQPYVLLTVDNTSLEKKDRVFKTIEQVLRTQADQGLDRDRVEAVLNHLEFVTREKDFGGMPRGLIYAMTVMESWLYGGDPAQNLCYDEAFASLRQKIQAGYLEQFIREVFLDNPHRAKLTMLPSKELGEKKQQAERQRLEQATADWDTGRRQTVLEEFQALRRRQEQPDAAEALAQLPTLSRRDIPETVPVLPTEEHTLNGATVLSHAVETDGITYLDLYFSLADIPQEQLSQVAFLARLLTQLPTEQWDVLSLRNEIEANLGAFSMGPTVLTDKNGTARAYLLVHLSLLEGSKRKALEILEQVLLHSKFEDETYIFNLLHQHRFGQEQAIIASGNRYAARRALAAWTPGAAVWEQFYGIGFLRWMQQQDRTFQENGAALCEALRQMAERIFTRTRVTVGVTGVFDRDFASGAVAALPEIPMGAPAVWSALPRRNEGFIIPAEVGFAAKASSLPRQSYSGSDQVAAQFLTYDYLWNTIRVKGGAYGTGLAANRNGDLLITSYRDPNPAQSLASFDGVSGALDALADSQTSLDKYIISTISATDPLLTPRMQGQQADQLWLCGITQADRQQERRQILHTTAEDLRRFSRSLQTACQTATACVIGGKTALEACGQTLDAIEALQA